MWNTGLSESQAGIKTAVIAGRNINNFRYTDKYHSNGWKWRGTEEPLDESERAEWKKADLSLNIQKTKIIVSGPIT